MVTIRMKKEELAVKEDEAVWVRRMASMYMNGMSEGEDSRMPESEPSSGAVWWALVLEGGPADLFNEKTVGDCLHQETYSTGTGAVPDREKTVGRSHSIL